MKCPHLNRAFRELGWFSTAPVTSMVKRFYFTDFLTIMGNQQVEKKGWGDLPGNETNRIP